jgi:acyl-CoA synthetase (AMP-forming)/AMP-acid ligase II
VPVAFVRRQAGASLTEAQVIAHCRGRIASFKIPRRVIFIDEFPMTSSGKIQKVKLRAEAEAEAAAGARRPGEAGTPP